MLYDGQPADNFAKQTSINLPVLYTVIIYIYAHTISITNGLTL